MEIKSYNSSLGTYYYPNALDHLIYERRTFRSLYKSKSNIRHNSKRITMVIL